MLFDHRFPIPLQERTRGALLETLYQDLHQNNVAIYGQISLLETKSAPEGTRIFDTFRRAITGKVRSPSLDSYNTKRHGNGVGAGALLSPGLPSVGEYELANQTSTSVSQPGTPKTPKVDVGSGGAMVAPIVVAGSSSTTNMVPSGLKAVCYNKLVCVHVCKHAEYLTQEW